jgi:hypothetical protein
VLSFIPIRTVDLASFRLTKTLSLAPFVARLEDTGVPGLGMAAQNHRPQIPQLKVAAESQGSSMRETA